MKNFLSEPTGSRKHRKPQPPLRTAKEMADEFGLTIGQLAGYLTSHSGPAPAMFLNANTGRNRVKLFNPAEMRIWWKNVNDDK